MIIKLYYNVYIIFLMWIIIEYTKDIIFHETKKNKQIFNFTAMKKELQICIKVYADRENLYNM